MQIAGLQKITLVDFPGHIAATVFTRGCSFRCPFCHNPELVLPDHFNPLLSESDFFAFLSQRQGKLQGICITGGEPLLHKDINDFISKIKEAGFKVKLDTNGSFPDKLEELIKEGNLDYVAMDIKASAKSYSVAAGTQVDLGNIKKSIRLIKDSGIDYEFRTTICHPIHTVQDFKGIAELIGDSKRFYIQNFVKSKHVDSTLIFEPFTEEEIKAAESIMKKNIKEVGVR